MSLTKFTAQAPAHDIQALREKVLASLEKVDLCILLHDYAPLDFDAPLNVAHAQGYDVTPTLHKYFAAPDNDSFYASMLNEEFNEYQTVNIYPDFTIYGVYMPKTHTWAVDVERAFTGRRRFKEVKG